MKLLQHFYSMNKELIEILLATAVLAALFLNITESPDVGGIILRQIKFFFLLIFTSVFVYSLIVICIYILTRITEKKWKQNNVKETILSLLVILGMLPFSVIFLLMILNLVFFIFFNFPKEATFIGYLFIMVIPLLIILIFGMFINNKLKFRWKGEIISIASFLAVLTIVYLVPLYYYLNYVLNVKLFIRF